MAAVASRTPIWTSNRSASTRALSKARMAGPARPSPTTSEQRIATRGRAATRRGPTMRATASGARYRMRVRAALRERASSRRRDACTAARRSRRSGSDKRGSPSERATREGRRRRRDCRRAHGRAIPVPASSRAAPFRRSRARPLPSAARALARRRHALVDRDENRRADDAMAGERQPPAPLDLG